MMAVVRNEHSLDRHVQPLESNPPGVARTPDELERNPEPGVEISEKAQDTALKRGPDGRLAGRHAANLAAGLFWG